MTDFNILHGLSTELFSAPGVVNPDLIIEEGHWYLCKDTAELFLGVKEQDTLVLKKINANILDQVVTSLIKLEIVDGNLLATYSDDSVVNLGKVNEDIPTNISVFTNDAGYATEQYVINTIAARVPVDTLAKKEEVVEVKTKLEAEVLPTIQETILPTVQELSETAATQEWVHAQIAKAELEDKEADLEAYYTKSEINGLIPDVSEFVTNTALENRSYATESFVDTKIASIPATDLRDYVKKDDLPDFTVFAKKTEQPDFSLFAKKSEVLTEIPAEYITESELASKDFATKDDIKNLIAEVPAEYITESELNAKGYLTEHQDLSEYAKKAELFGGSYNDLTDTPEIPSIKGLASEEYVDNAITNIEYPTVDLSNYALKSELKAKANEIPFTRSKFVTKATGSFSIGDDVRGLTIAEILAKLLGLEADAEPEGIIEEIVAYEIPMYTVTSEGVLTEVPYNYINLDVETAIDEPTESGFYQIVDQSGNIIESGYQEMQAYSNDIYYVIALPKKIDYNTMVAIQGYNTSLKVWAEVEKFEMTCDTAQVEMLCSEAGIDISHIDTSIYTIWASETCPTGSKLRYIINEEEAAI